MSNNIIDIRKEAAKKVGVNKKTLDYFLGKLRLGIVLNFKFEENVHKPFKVLL